MYNEERKQGYIEEAKKHNRQLEKILALRFSETAPIEEKLGKDLCEWTANEILNYYKTFISRSVETLIGMHSALNQYAKWCLKNNFMEDSQNHFEEIDREILNQECVNKAYLSNGIVTREELLSLLSDPSIKNYYEKFIILALFEGIGGKGFSDFMDLTMDNFKDGKVELHNRTIAVSEELVRLAKASSECYEYFPAGNPRWNRDFITSDKRIVKALEGTDPNPKPLTYRHRMIVKLLNFAKEQNNPIFNSAMLFESGRLEMVRNFMKKDGTDAITAIKQHDDEIAIQYSKIYAKERYVDKWSQFLSLTD